MQHLETRIVEKAAWQSKELGQYIQVLQTYGFVGAEKQRVYQLIKDFLWGYNIPFMSNARGMIWLSTCEEGMMRIFQLEDKNQSL